MSSETKQKSEKDLRKDLASQKESLRNFRFGVAGSKAKNIKEGMNIRKGIARILTELNSRKQG